MFFPIPSQIDSLDDFFREDFGYAMHFSESMNRFVFCELAFGIWKAHCHILLQSFLQMILSRGDNSTDLCYTLNTYDGSTWAQTQEPLELCLMPQPLIFPTQKLCQKNPGMWDCQCVLLALAVCTITISGKSPSHWCRWSLQSPGNFLGTRDRSHGRENSVAWKNRRKNPIRNTDVGWFLAMFFFFFGLNWRI